MQSEKGFKHGWTRMDPAWLTPQPKRGNELSTQRSQRFSQRNAEKSFCAPLRCPLCPLRLRKHLRRPPKFLHIVGRINTDKMEKPKCGTTGQGNEGRRNKADALAHGPYSPDPHSPDISPLALPSQRARILRAALILPLAKNAIPRILPASWERTMLQAEPGRGLRS